MGEIGGSIINYDWLEMMRCESCMGEFFLTTGHILWKQGVGMTLVGARRIIVNVVFVR